jgi:hypothetical protein
VRFIVILLLWFMARIPIGRAASLDRSMRTR